MWEEKKIAKLHIRCTEALADAVRQSAICDRRPMQDQWAVLAEEALLARGHFINGNVARRQGNLPLNVSQHAFDDKQRTDSLPPIDARSRAVTRTKRTA